MYYCLSFILANIYYFCRFFRIWIRYFRSRARLSIAKESASHSKLASQTLQDGLQRPKLLSTMRSYVHHQVHVQQTHDGGTSQERERLVRMPAVLEGIPVWESSTKSREDAQRTGDLPGCAGDAVLPAGGQGLDRFGDEQGERKEEDNNTRNGSCFEVKSPAQT